MKNEDSIMKVKELMERLRIKGEIIIHKRMSGELLRMLKKLLEYQGSIF